MASRRSRWRVATWFWIVGAVVVAAGFGTVIASIFSDQSTVSDFARTPVGCVTTFEAAETTTLYVYVESRGRIDDVGDCSNDDRSYDRAEESAITVTIADVDGRVVDQSPIVESVDYDLPDFAGSAIARLPVERGQRYRVLLESDDLSPVVAIGPRVVPVESTLAIIGAVVVMAGGVILVIALVMSLVSRRRRRREPWAPPTLEDRAAY